MDIRREILSYLHESKLVHTAQVSELRPIIAIDGEAYMQSLLHEDFYSQVLGGCNFTLKPHLTFALNKFKEKGITPVFIFNGVPLREETSGIAKRYKRCQRLWDKLSKNQVVDIEKLLIKQEVSSCENLREVFSIIRAEGGEVMKAPSYAGFQLAHLSKSVAGVMGGVDLASFGLGKVVVGVDFEEGVYSYIVVSDVLKELSLSSRQFTEILISKGFWTGRKLLKTPVLDLLQSPPQALPEKDQAEVGRFFSLIDSEFYLSKDSEKLHHKPHPDIQALVLLPLSSSIVSAYIKKVDVMTPPVADSLKYRALVAKYKPVMRRIYSTLHHLFDSPGGLKGIKTFYWYDEIQPFQIDFEPVKELNFEELLHKFEASNEKKIDLQAACKLHISAYMEKKDLASGLKSGSDLCKIRNVEALKFKIYLKVLHATGVIGPDFKPTLFEQVVTLAHPLFQSQTLVLLELLRLGLLDWKSMSLIKVPESVLKKIAPDSADLALLISRVCSLVPGTLSHDTWTSSVDHDLAQFYSLTSHIGKVHQYLAEVFLLEEFITNRVEISSASVSEFLPQLELVPLNSVVVGILAKRLLEGASLADLSKEIPQAIDVAGDLNKAWWFFKEFLNIVFTLTKDSDEVRGILEQASKTFKTALINSGIHVI